MGVTGLFGTTQYIGLVNEGRDILISRIDANTSYLKLGTGNANNSTSQLLFYNNGLLPTTVTGSITRNAGANGTFIIANAGTGSFQITQNGVSSLVINNIGDTAMNDITGTSLGVTGNIACARIGVGNGTTAAPGIYFTADGSTNTGIYRPAEDTIAFSTGNIARMTIDNTGVGIGAGYYFRNKEFVHIESLASTAARGLGATPQIVIVSMAGGSPNGGIFWCVGTTVTQIAGAGIATTNTGTTYALYWSGTEFVFQNKTAGAISVGLFSFARG